MRSFDSKGNIDLQVNNFWDENGAGLVTPSRKHQTTSPGKLWGGIPKGRERGDAPETAGDGTLMLNWSRNRIQLKRSWTKSPNSSSLARGCRWPIYSTWSKYLSLWISCNLHFQLWFINSVLTRKHYLNYSTVRYDWPTLKTGRCNVHIAKSPFQDKLFSFLFQCHQ